MKRKLIIPALLVLLLLTACSAQNRVCTSFEGSAETMSPILGLSHNSTFEAALQDATDAVVAQYVGHRNFGITLVEYEFIVLDRILGSATDRIFLYEYRTDNLSFSRETDYLLVLHRISVPFYGNLQDEAFVLIDGIVIDLNNPPASMMRGEELSEHSTSLNFNSRSLSSDQIVAYVMNLTRNNEPSTAPIMSDRLEDIIDGSPHVLIVEVNEPWRLMSSVRRYDWDQMETDIFYTTVLRTLKGDYRPGDTVRVVFFADTVQTGEQHIVAVSPASETTRFFYGFTSRHSLFRMEQLNEIMEILGLDPEPSEGSYEIDIYVSSLGLLEYEYDSLNNHFSISMFWTEEVDFVPSLYRVSENGIRTRVPDSEIQSVVSVGGSGMDGIGKITITLTNGTVLIREFTYEILAIGFGLSEPVEPMETAVETEAVFETTEEASEATEEVPETTEQAESAESTD